LNQTKVAAIPGDAFFTGQRGSRLLRFCFAKSSSDLDEACRRLAELR